MSFTKSSIAGFATGFVVAVVVGRIRVPRPAFLISADKKERLSKKEAAARLNDANEDRELLFGLIFIDPEKDNHDLIQTIRLKAMLDPRWEKVFDTFTTPLRDDDARRPGEES